MVKGYDHDSFFPGRIADIDMLRTVLENSKVNGGLLREKIKLLYWVEID